MMSRMNNAGRCRSASPITVLPVSNTLTEKPPPSRWWRTSREISGSSSTTKMLGFTVDIVAVASASYLVAGRLKTWAGIGRCRSPPYFHRKCGTCSQAVPYKGLVRCAMNRTMILLFWLVSAAVVFAQQGTEHNAGDGTAQEKFVSGGTIRMHLEAGSYTIEGSDSSDIVATCTADTPEQLRHVRVLIRTSGTNAELSVKGTPHNNFHATIEVPRLSNLWLRLSAGD